MKIFIPYLVLLGIVLLYFIICWFIFKTSKQKKGNEKINRSHISYDMMHRESVDYGENYRKKRVFSHQFDGKNSATNLLGESGVDYDQHGEAYNVNTVYDNPKGSAENLLVEEDLTRLIPAFKKDEIYASEGMTKDDKTMVIPSVSDKTLVMPCAKTDTLSVEKEEPMKAVEQQGFIGTQEFVEKFPYSSQENIDLAEEITEEAYRRLGIEGDDEIRLFIDNIIIQEALLCMQKAYCATPTGWMKETALEAFVDVVQQPKSSTTYLLAFDALHILPHLSLGHFQAMAIILLFKYSRNSNNFSIKNFQHYVRKYVEPFLSDLMVDKAPYSQLEYLRCTIDDNEGESFFELLSQSYPFVFNYQGFTKDELASVITQLDKKFLVESINSNLFKLAIVDESMAPRLFRLANIKDIMLQRQLLTLMKSRPVKVEGLEIGDILSEISPVLLGLSRTYNRSPLATTTLTLLGLYLARVHVKVTIGESFDLSRFYK